MHIKDNIINFLYDKNYFINIYNNYIHLYNYEDLISLDDNILVIIINNSKLTIKGNNFKVIKMSKNELLLSGNVYNMEFKNE